MLKDHLGNVRVLLTEERQIDKYPTASLEPSKIATEKTFYDIQDAQVVDNSEATGITPYVNDNGIGNNPADPAFETTNSAKLYKLNSNTAKTGLGITLKVMAGDKIDVFGKSYYFQNNPGSSFNNNLPIIDLLTAFLGTPAAAATTSVHGAVTPAGINTTTGTAGINSMMAEQNNQSNTAALKPKAFINVIFFDEQFKAVDYKVSIVGDNSVVKDHYADLQNLVVPKSGFVYIYCSNETPVNVFFDNMQVVHTRGAILSEDHYYPFGLVMSGISSKAAGSLANHKKFINQEFNEDLGLDLYEFRYRNHDPQIGRFIEIDPLADKYVYNSTYAYAENKVINGFDLEGLEFFGFNTPLLGSNSNYLRPVIETVTEVGAKSSEVVGKTVEVGTKLAKVEQDHHLIPRQLKGDPIVESARKAGFKFEGSENKMPVEKFSKATGEGQHGNHPNYNTEIVQRFAKFKEANPNFTPEQAVKFLRNTVSDMKNEINQGGKVNDIFNGKSLLTPAAADGIKVGLPVLQPIKTAPKPVRVPLYIQAQIQIDL
jgi:RHS repeat-associated protein